VDKVTLGSESEIPEFICTKLMDVEMERKDAKCVWKLVEIERSVSLT